MPEGKLYPILSQPGIKRDGTKVAGNYYTDGQWCRFQRGLPRKIGGYKQIISGLPNIVRDTFVVPISPNFNVYVADFESLKYFPIDQFGNNLGPLVDRTPAFFVSNPNNIWQFDSLYITTSNASNLIAHAAPNLASIDSAIDAAIYYGDINANTQLVPTGFSVSGGIVSLNPYLVAFGNAGHVLIFDANNPTVLMNEARVTSQKIVAGLPTRGGNSSPAGLLWSLNSLIRMTQAGTAGIDFRFDTITDQSSILSSSSVIEYDSRYFWCGIDRFLMYNGIVQEVPNQLNLNFFFQNLNYAQRQKVWATKVPQYGEIWWFYPYGNATECDEAVIYNVRENTWYDTGIDRSSGYFEQVYADPIWTKNTPDLDGTYSVWTHETGYDENVNGTLTAIDCFIETGDISWCAVGPEGTWTGTDRWVDLYRVEPDFWQQVGDITMSIKGTQYAQSTVEDIATYTLTVNQEKQDLREQRRFMTIRFDTNTVGGFFELGQLLLYFRIGDTRA